jgi:hypothetical protein
MRGLFQFWVGGIGLRNILLDVLNPLVSLSRSSIGKGASEILIESF